MGPRQRQEGRKEGEDQAGRRNGIFGISHTDGQTDRPRNGAMGKHREGQTVKAKIYKKGRTHAHSHLCTQDYTCMYMCVCVCIGAESNTEIQSEGQRTTDVGNVLDDGQPQS